MNEISVCTGRKLSLEGAVRIGTGAMSDVYQINEEDVVKVLKTYDFEDAAREIRLSKWAFVQGIPTAISYDVADVDGHPGLVYESLGRSNLRKEFLDHPDDFDAVLDRYIAFVKKINSTDAGDEELPSARVEYLERLEAVKQYLSAEDYEKMKALLTGLPECSTLVHRDCHIKNIKVKNGELFLIDLDTLSTGSPIFELMALDNSYSGFPFAQGLKEGFEPFFQVPLKLLTDILSEFYRRYFEGLPEADLQENIRKIRVLAYFQMLVYAWIDTMGGTYDIDALTAVFRENLHSVEDLILKF